MKRLFASLLSLVAAIDVAAGEYGAQSLLCTTTPVVMWIPTTAVTYTNGFYSTGSTNILYTNAFGVALAPHATNATTGGVNPTWAPNVNNWVDVSGAIPAATMMIDFTSAASAASAATLYFARSVDGTYYDTNTMWSVAVTPTAATVRTVIVTNVPAWLLTGSRTIQLHKVYSASQGGAGYWSWNQIQIGGFR